jgi:hypothetical protein
MHKPAAETATAAKASLLSGRPDEASVRLVCLALVLALLVLAARIASIW